MPSKLKPTLQRKIKSESVRVSPWQTAGAVVAKKSATRTAFLQRINRIYLPSFSSWLAQIVRDGSHLLRSENAHLGLIAQITEFAAQVLVEVNPLMEASPSGVGADVGEVELCQFSATVCPNAKHITK